MKKRWSRLHSSVNNHVSVELELDEVTPHVTWETSVCYATILVNDQLHISIVTIKSFPPPGAVFVECIVRCKQLSIKLLDEERPASSDASFTLQTSRVSVFVPQEHTVQTGLKL